ncbi:MAG: hypothetical protein NZ750_11325 [Anaerolineae bacterium]|nr:hypothetical protein [Anaerolineae bacterium]MDW8172079.1 hypothetical protein [Anaerolineae bacterium]
MHESSKCTPRLGTLYRLALALDVDANYFLTTPPIADAKIGDAVALLSALSPDVHIT